MEWNETNNNGNKLQFSDYFEIVRPKNLRKTPRLQMEIDYEGIHIELFETNHIPDNAISLRQAFLTYGLFIDNRILISGDTKFDDELIKMYADKAEIIFHDASFISNPVHASLKELKKLSKKIKEKTYLMHYSDDWQNYNYSEFAGLAKQGVRYIF